jgi:hypothetical protein
VFEQVLFSKSYSTILKENKMKKRILIVGVLVVSIAVLVTGAFAYFNSQTVNTGNISSGTLTLKVASGADCDTLTFGDSTTVWSMANMAPGDFVDGYLCMKNTGTIPANQVTFEWVYDPALEPLANKINVVSIFDSTDPGDQIAAVIPLCDITIPALAGDGICSLTELAYLSNHFGYPFDAVSGVAVPWLPAGGTQWLYMKLQFDPTAGNDLQGLSFLYTLKVTAEQVHMFP